VSVIAEIVLAVDVLTVDVLVSLVETTVLLLVGVVVEAVIELGVDGTTVFLAIGLAVVGVLVVETTVFLSIGVEVEAVVELGVAETTVFIAVGVTAEILFACT
jgi:hypothetical protein